jgi:hypothetical protein
MVASSSEDLADPDAVTVGFGRNSLLKAGSRPTAVAYLLWNRWFARPGRLLQYA